MILSRTVTMAGCSIGKWTGLISHVVVFAVIRAVSITDEYHCTGNGQCFARLLNSDFIGAKGICEGYGGKLAEFDTQDTLDEVVARLSTTNKGDWIGATDEQTQGDFLWLTSQTPVTLTSWAAKQPDNKPSKDCLLLDSDGKLTDFSCSANRNFICQLGADLFESTVKATTGAEESTTLSATDQEYTASPSTGVSTHVIPTTGAPTNEATVVTDKTNLYGHLPSVTVDQFNSENLHIRLIMRETHVETSLVTGKLTNTTQPSLMQCASHCATLVTNPSIAACNTGNNCCSLYFNTKSKECILYTTTYADADRSSEKTWRFFTLVVAEVL